MKIREIQCKSAIGKCGFPGGGLAINPYVGCGHSCVYCLDGGTLILMADGTIKLLKDLKVGDKIYGVRKDKNTGFYYYKVTKVLTRWKSRKPAFKILADEGIEVICSPDHRWLSSSRGWKYTFGRMAGRLRRPHLTKNNAIQGVGKLITGPKESDLYVKGYLSGIIRGDGLLKSYDYSGRRRNKDFQTMNPAIKRKIVLEGKQVKRSFRVKEIINLHVTREMYDITTGTGTFIANGLISHNCYARFIKRFTGHTEEWGSFVDARINIAEIIKKQLKSPKYRGERIFIGTVTDPYQPIEKKYKLTRSILKVLMDYIKTNFDISNPSVCYKNPVSILTKSDLVLRDIDLLKKFKDIDVNFTVTTLDEKWKKLVEPNSSSIRQRLNAMEKLTKEGITVLAMMGPYWPVFTDPEALFKEFKRVGVRHIFTESFNTVGGNWTGVEKVLKRHYQKLLHQIRETLFDKKKFYEFYNKAQSKIKQLSKKYRIPVTIYFGLGHAAKFK